MASSLAMLFIAWTIYFNKKLQAHPAQFIGLFSISLSILMWMLPATRVVCPGNAEVLFAQTVYFSTSTEAQLKAMNTLTYSYLTISTYLFVFPVLIEICLIHDMVSTLTRPMQKPESRAKLYYLFVGITSVVVLCIFEAYDFDTKYFTVQFTYYAVKVMYLGCSIPSIIFVYFHFQKGGLNNQYRKVYLHRYVLYAILFSLCAFT